MADLVRDDSRVTTLDRPKSPRHGEPYRLVGDSHDPAAAGRRIREWWDRMHSPDFETSWAQRVDAAVRGAAVEAAMHQSWLEDRVSALDAETTSLRLRIDQQTSQIEQLGLELGRSADAARLQSGEIDRIVSSRSWRWTAPLRRLSRHRVLGRGRFRSQGPFPPPGT